jgi:hypothetical protein
MNVPARIAAHPAPALAAYVAAAIVKLQGLVAGLRMPAPAVPEATAQLLRLAASYESTQPSYAADLRAAASMGQQTDPPLPR